MSARSEYGFEGELFECHHGTVLRCVRMRVSGPDALVEDACSFAWVQLLTHEVDRDAAVGWLITVATHEAWRLSAQQARTQPLDEHRRDPEAGFGAEPIGGPTASLELQVEARDALARVAALPARQRRVFGRQVAGLRYVDIAAETGDSYRTVNRQLLRAHRAICEGSRTGTGEH